MMYTCTFTHSPWQAQVAVKESKQRYEKLKFDLGEKIDMVSASRCNLLSRSLPNYQKEVLSFYDNAANEFHKILVDLRSHHHHQYKVRRLAEEIRDLEAEESPFSDESGLLGKSSNQATLEDDVPLLDVGGGSTSERQQPGAPVSNGAADEVKKKEEGTSKRMLGSDQFSIEKIQEEAKVKDLALSGIEAELRELQKEVLQPSSSAIAPSSSAQQQQSSPTPDQRSGPREGAANKDQHELNEFRDLLRLEDDEETADGASKSPQPSQDKLFDDWSSFSAFMSTTTTQEERTANPTSGWEKDLMSASSDNSSILQEGGVLSPTLAPQTTKSTSQNSEEQKVSPSTAGEVSGETSKESKEGKIAAGSGGGVSSAGSSNSTSANPTSPASDLLSEELKALGISSESTAPVKAPPKPALGADMESLDPLYFSQQQQLPPQSIVMSTTGVPQYPSAMMSMSMAHPAPPFPYDPGQPQQQQPPMFRSPQSNSQRPILASALASSYQTSGPGFPVPPLGKVPTLGAGVGSGLKANGSRVGADGQDKEEKEKAASWMNVFAHLDPLVNEKV